MKRLLSVIVITIYLFLSVPSSFAASDMKYSPKEIKELISNTDFIVFGTIIEIRKHIGSPNDLRYRIKMDQLYTITDYTNFSQYYLTDLSVKGEVGHKLIMFLNVNDETGTIQHAIPSKDYKSIVYRSQDYNYVELILPQLLPNESRKWTSEQIMIKRDVENMLSYLENSNYYKRNKNLFLGTFIDKQGALIISVSKKADFSYLEKHLAKIFKNSPNYLIRVSNLPEYVTATYLKELSSNIVSKLNNLTKEQREISQVASWNYDILTDQYIVEIVNLDTKKQQFFTENISDWEYITFKSVKDFERAKAE